MRTRRFTVEIPDDALQQLAALALAERRDTRDQAAVIILRALARRTAPKPERAAG